jgi:hypothetical protein
MEKHPSSLRTFANYGLKKFYNDGPRTARTSETPAFLASTLQQAPSLTQSQSVQQVLKI